MTDQQKANREGKGEASFGFPFGSRKGMFEMMGKCCPSDMNFSDCVSMMQTMMDKQSGKSEEEQKTE